MLLANKVALITGAARGIGRAIAIRFAEEGCQVAVVVRSMNENAESLVQHIEQAGGVCRAYVGDAANFGQAQTIVEQVVNDFGRIDILVNNAGITRDTLLPMMTEEQWDSVLQTNLKSVFNFTRAASLFMIPQRSGAVISLSSIVGIQGNAGQSNYAASKAGIVAFTQSVAKELGKRNIRVNAIAPGYIETDMTAAVPQDIRNEMVKHIALHRPGRAEEVANTAVFLASDMASYISGQVLRVDGAM